MPPSGTGGLNAARCPRFYRRARVLARVPCRPGRRRSSKSAASQSAEAAAELAAEIVNGPYPELIAHNDRAGSSDPTNTQQALRQTDLKPSQLVIRYNGVRFDETAQNILSATYLVVVWSRSAMTIALARNGQACAVSP
jgi:hypothetical protein